jgi:4-hydroxymandelate synthase
MAAQDIEYVELYASDVSSAIDYFVSSLGFAQAAESSSEEGEEGQEGQEGQEGGRSQSVLLRQGTVQVIVTGGPATRAFLEEHGDGIADIAFTCDDVAGTFSHAVAAGASVISQARDWPTVSGFGGTRHTLVTRSAGAGLPPGRRWTPTPAVTSGTGRIRLLDHVAVCVAGGTLTSIADFYTDGFGLAPYSSEYTEAGDQAMRSIVVRSPSGGVTFTLLEPDAEKEPGQLDSFLSRNGGDGVQHLAFAVDDITPAVHEFTDRGVNFLDTPDTYYEMLGERLPDVRDEIADLRAAHVLVDRDEWGYLLQLFTRSPYERNTLFYELVQRRGARGFGSANIKALYEAVERQRLTAR